MGGGGRKDGVGRAGGLAGVMVFGAFCLFHHCLKFLNLLNQGTLLNWKWSKFNLRNVLN